MSQIDSFEQNNPANLEEHLAGIELLIQSKLNELESLEGVKRTLQSVLGIQPVKSFAKLELVKQPELSIAHVA